jgi:glucose-1-phosphate thymidylyltransferase
MKIVIPLAGYGKRLRPHTYTKPKPLMNVAGKPVLGHVLDMFTALEDVEEIIFIVGHLGEQIEEYVEKNYPHIRACYYEQKELNGQSTALYLAQERLSGPNAGPMLMVFVDTIVETDLSHLNEETVDAITWVKEIEDPRRFGVAEVGPDGFVTRLIEKPQDMSNNLVVVGFYYFKDSGLLIDCIREQVEKDIRIQNEYFLADAVNLMLARGLKMRVQRVDIWQDCGKTETVLETNRYLLSHGHDNSAEIKSDEVVIVPPVNIHATARIKNSIVGPFATIAAGCQLEDSIVQDSILDEGATVRSALLKQSLIGRDARLTGRFRTFNLGDSSEVGFE